MSGLRLLLTALALSLLGSACGNDTVEVANAPETAPPSGPDGVPEPAPRVGPDGVPEAAPPSGPDDGVPEPRPCEVGDWVVVDAGPFTMRLPADLVDLDVQGTDSLVGQYERPGMEVFYDYGGFTNDFGDLVDGGAAVETVTVDGFEGRLVIADAGTAWAERSVTGLYVSTGAADGFSNALGLSIVYDDEDDRPVARCITESVEFELGAPVGETSAG